MGGDTDAVLRKLCRCRFGIAAFERIVERVIDDLKFLSKLHMRAPNDGLRASDIPPEL